MMITGAGREFIIKDTHRGLYYEDGKLSKILKAGHYKIPPRGNTHVKTLLKRKPGKLPGFEHSKVRSD